MDRTYPRTSTRLTVTGVVLVLLAVTAIVVALLGRSSLPSADAQVVMEGYRFSPTALDLPVGEPVTLELVNRDEVGHHVSFGREVVEVDRRPAAFAEDLFAGLDPRVTPTNAQVDPRLPDGGLTVLVQGGDTVTIEVTFPEDRAGTWQIGCFTGRGCHYRAGLAAEVTLR